MLKIWAKLFFPLFLYVRLLNAISCRFFISSQLPSNLDVREGLLSAGNVSLIANGTQECFTMFKQCITIWKYDPVHDDYADVLFQVFFHSLPVDQVETDELTFAVAICASFFIVATLAMTYLLSRACSWSKSVLSLCTRDSDDKLLLSDVNKDQNNAKTKSIKLDDVKLSRVLYTGRYSTVWLAELKTDGSLVALKLYASGLQRYGINEIRVLGLPLMKHENMVKYLASANLTAKAREGQNIECWLLTEYLPNGSLTDYLNANSLSWDAMCKLASSVAKGVAYLHAEVSDGDLYKPAVAHRDINSRNVLVKLDGTCAICDFAFAVILETLSQHTGRRDPSLAEVGTVRYMAPELLEGAANLRDPETTLKQLDVYALGLVLWEIVSRCEDVYALNGATVPAYELPYGKDVSANPSLEEMQRVVCKNKKRPSFPTAMYRPKGGPLYTLRELIEDCWDQDSDARITALCAQERLAELCTIACPADPMEIHEFGSVVQQESPNSRSRRADGAYIHQPSFNGDSTTDTSQTDTSGFASVGLGSSDRGRSCASSLGYQTNRSLSSAQRLQQFESQHTESVEHPSSTQDSIDGREEGLSNQIVAQEDTSGDHDSGASFGNSSRQLAKDAVYPLLLLKSARICLRNSFASEESDGCAPASDRNHGGVDQASIPRSQSPHVIISLPQVETDGATPI
ncbi:bone morphogenetic protein receptor type 2 [Trichuris trichiura]|uniref:receptor protein serine/threonine kinase n=1 Tax=Trichuris trichiura TaxID=36087 RepID=A0A077ZFR8_TRITR|nr:bone morphogenetic protein receptor type 2 [Trichuris trichiura]